MGLYGAIEAGGTKMVCAVASGPGDIRSETSLPTETPQKTLPAIIAYFQDYQQKNNVRLDAVGIGCFGPLDLNENSKTYGYITQTPKLDWRNTDFLGIVKKHLNVPVGFDTDVNAAALGEYLWGAGKGLDVVVYLTVGTGIGGGLYIYGKLLHGLMHPEMGHILIQQHKSDPFTGACPYHKGCLEGLASGRAVDLRWNTHASKLPDDHPAWDLEADYLAQGLINYIVTVSPQKLILGGGLMHKKQLYPLIRKKVQEKLNGYIAVSAIQDDIDNYIVSPGLGTRAGICGAIGLAMKAEK
jgi:fructokinase